MALLDARSQAYSAALYPELRSEGSHTSFFAHSMGILVQQKRAITMFMHGSS
jgi:hypothetical protein